MKGLRFSSVFRSTHWPLALLALVACGRIDGGSDDSSADGETGGGASVGGSSSEQSATGGGSNTGVGSNTGGNVATGGSGAGQGASTGGTVNDLPEAWGPCNFEHPGLEPPCGESDVNGVHSSCSLFFDVPLTHVATPAVGLQVVLLPLEPGEEVGGGGGTGSAPTEPLPLDVISIFPEEPERVPGSTFDLEEPAGYVRAGTHPDEPPGYVTGTEEYGIAKVALLQGTEILSVHRGLYNRPASELCIK